MLWERGSDWSHHILGIPAVSPHAFPESSKSPHSANTSALLPPPDALTSFSYLTAPHGADPAPQAVFQLLLLDSALLGNEAGCYAPLDDFRRQNAALDQRLSGRAQREAPR